MHRIALFAYARSTDAVTWAEYAATRLLEEGVQVILEAQLAEAVADDVRERCKISSAADFERHADMVMTFGGDGTLLAASQVLIGTDVPIMGVNVGRLGFLAEYQVSNLDDGIMSVLKGDYRLVERSTLEVTWSGGTVYALNEALVERTSGSKMITIRAHVNDHLVADYRCDAVLVATPTGSTAYSLAAGGPIIAPSAEVLCVTAVSPHALTIRPLVVGDDSVIRLLVHEDTASAQLLADGRVLGTAQPGDYMTVRKSERPIKLVKRSENTYYDLLRDKLLWSANATKK